MNLYNHISNIGRKILGDYKKREYKMGDTDTINYNNIKINRLNAMFNSDHSMMVNVIVGKIEKKMNRITFITLLSGWFFLFVVIFLSYLLNTIIFILIMVLGLDLIVLYYNIYFEIIIPDKIKEIYNNGYWMKGYILDGDLIIDIDEFFFSSEDLEKYRDEVINSYLEIKTKEKG